ncbi:hypothetical protein CMI37_16160 [Candidatus Pacearchaeota archaeon]|nr:hypothetical protein [Candidatus Pacearchaeota archaeon]|tara:strand:+ start:824 stop:2068 length:1245 start_codon:yes stop_codon:yes gene_type:complete
MAESTLTLTVDELRDQITEEFYGGLYSALSSNEKTIVGRLVDSGIRQFNSPPPVGGLAHEWSFLFPASTLSIEAPYSTGTIAYDDTGGSSENLITLSGGTWPSWAAEANIRISGTDYPVYNRVSDTLITLGSSDNPGADVAASTAYNLHKDDYTLPDNFGRVMGAFTFAQSDNAWYTAQIVGESRIRELRMRGSNNASSQGDPRFAAIRPVSRNDNYTTGTVGYDHTGASSERLIFSSGATFPSWAGSAKIRIASTTYDVETRVSDTQLNLTSSSNPGGDVSSGTSYTLMHASGGRQEVVFWPNITASATVTYRYRILPDQLTDTNLYPYGATDHSEAILYSCLAEAERRLDGERGVYWQRFVECLAGSIARDSRDNAPDHFGYNGDMSDGRAVFSAHRDYLFGSAVSYKGQGT